MAEEGNAAGITECHKENAARETVRTDAPSCSMAAVPAVPSPIAEIEAEPGERDIWRSINGLCINGLCINGLCINRLRVARIDRRGLVIRRRSGRRPIDGAPAQCRSQRQGKNKLDHFHDGTPFCEFSYTDYRKRPQNDYYSYVALHFRQSIYTCRHHTLLASAADAAMNFIAHWCPHEITIQPRF